MPELDKNVYLHLSVRDFGPIAEGAVDLKPLTLFIGPNSTGKSYMAMLVRAVAGVLCPINARWDSRVLNDAEDDARAAVSALGEGGVPALDPSKGLELPVDLVLSVANRTLPLHVRRTLSRELAYWFGADCRDVVRRGAVQAEVVYDCRLYDAHAAISVDGVSVPAVACKQVSAILPAGTRAGGRADPSEYLVEVVVGYASPGRICHYVPASRCGLMQLRQSLTERLWELSALGGAEARLGPAAPGVIARFMAGLAEPYRVVSPLVRVADGLASEMLNGRIERVDTSGEVMFGENGSSIPLHRASSSVAEVAPIVVYLTSIVRPDDILIIEEPEAHLHPAHQRVLAKYLVRLVRQGVKLILTTHSDYLLAQFSNYVTVSGLSEERRAKLGCEAEDHLAPDEVGAYLFDWVDREDRSLGSRVTQLEVTAEHGIPQDEYARVAEALDDQRVDILLDRDREGE